MDSIDDWAEALRSSNKLVLVEGKKDRQALNCLGITNIKTIAQKPLFKTVEESANASAEVVILTDLDREGRKYYSYLKHHLQKNGIKVDKKFREFLFANTEVTQIEAMKKLI